MWIYTTGLAGPGGQPEAVVARGVTEGWFDPVVAGGIAADPRQFEGWPEWSIFAKCAAANARRLFLAADATIRQRSKSHPPARLHADHLARIGGANRWLATAFDAVGMAMDLHASAEPHRRFVVPIVHAIEEYAWASTERWGVGSEFVASDISPIWPPIATALRAAMQTEQAQSVRDEIDREARRLGYGRSTAASLSQARSEVRLRLLGRARLVDVPAFANASQRSARRIQQRCRTGDIPGSRKGWDGSWLIPAAHIGELEGVQK